MHLGADLSNMKNIDSQECWATYSDSYFMAAVTNVESVFGKVWFKFSAKVCYPSGLWLL